MKYPKEKRVIIMKAIVVNKKLENQVDIKHNYENQREFYKRISERLTAEERLFILENLENKSCNNCDNGNCSIGTFEKIGIDAEEKSEGHSCMGWYNSEFIGKSKVLKIMDVYKLK